MEQIKKKLRLMDRLKWMSGVFGLIIYLALEGPFGQAAGIALGLAFFLGFFFLCRDAKNDIICDHIVEDLEYALRGMNQEDCAFQIKLTNAGLIIRVYLFRAREMAPRCSKVILDAIAGSWYRSRVWITQIVDVNSHEEIRDAELALNEELLANLRKKKERKE